MHYGGIEAVKGISLDVPEGEIVTLIGRGGLDALGAVEPYSGKPCAACGG